MTQESAITPEMRAAIGVESEPRTSEVEKGAIIKFAEAIGDTNPIYNEEAAARQSRYGGMIAPPTFLRSMSAGPLKVDVRSPYGNYPGDEGGNRRRVGAAHRKSRRAR